MDAGSLQPVTGAQVFIPGTAIGTISSPTGTYRLEGVPAGATAVSVRLIGFREASDTVEVLAGQLAMADFALEQTALRLQDIVVAGLVAETPRVKLPFTVERLDAQDLPVPASNVSTLLSGKAPGVTVAAVNGQPGQEAAINLRGPTSINAVGRSQAPLIVIDGIQQANGASLADIGALDVASVEIVKGAAAASLYGAKAQAGVIEITTKRGTYRPGNETEAMIRAEYGVSHLIGSVDLAQNHRFLMNPATGKFIDTKGNEVDYADFISGGDADGNGIPVRRDPATTFQDQIFPGPVYDHVNRFFDPGETISLYGALTGRFPQASYRASFERYLETGIVDCGDACRNPIALQNFGDDYAVKAGGFERWNGRLNVDARIGDVDVAASGFYSRSSQDDVTELQTSGADMFFGLLARNPFVDLTKPDARGLPDANPDPLDIAINPLYQLAIGEARDNRARTMGSLNLTWVANDWLSFDANASFDRADRDQAIHWPKTTVDNSGRETGGSLALRNVVEEAANASLTANFSRSFLDGALVARAKARVLGESQSFSTNGGEGSNFVVTDVPTFGALEKEGTTADREIRDIKALGYFGILGLDYQGRYIVDALIRRDGSSLFGPEQRWHTYLRGSAAWRVTEEDFWNVGWIDELKLRFSIGTAGGRPNFFSQYETYDVTGGTVLSPNTLGNRSLRPEFSTEREAGLDLVLFDDLAIDLTYAWNTIDDQILVVPQPSYRGFSQQWQNAGEIKSNTWEASLRWAAIDQPDMGLTFRLNWDKTHAYVSRMDINDFVLSGFLFSEGEEIGSVWGQRFASSCLDVARSLGMFTTEGLDCGQFQLNDDGYMVWVGQGNDFTHGSWRGLWGTEGDVSFVDLEGNADSATFDWGLPIQTREQSRACLRRHPEDRDIGEQCPLVRRVPVSSTEPDWNGAFATTFRYKGLTASALLDATIGFDLLNITRYLLMRVGVAGELDQAEKSDWLKKPMAYYGRLIGAVSGGQPEFREDGGWVKLREVGVAYTFPRSWLQGFLGGALDRVTLSFIGRNLLTITDYSGFDPEVGFNSNVGSATIDRWDDFQYPNSRTFSLALEVAF